MKEIVVALDDRQYSIGGSFQPVVSFPALPLRFPCRPARFEFPLEYLFCTAYSTPHRAFRVRSIYRRGAYVAASSAKPVQHPAGLATARTDQARRSHAAGRNSHQPHGEALPCRCKDQQARRKVLVFAGSKARQFIEIGLRATPAIPAGKDRSCHG